MPFKIRISANSKAPKLGLNTKSFMPTSYLYLASFKNFLSFKALPGSNDSNQSSISVIPAGISDLE